MFLLEVGLGISRTNADSQWKGIQFTTCFIEIFVVKTKPFVGSFVHVILTQQTCGQRSSRAAESKRRALGNYFSERISYMFPISKCRGDRDLGLFTTSVLAFAEPQRDGKIRKKTCFDVGKIGFCHRAEEGKTKEKKREKSRFRTPLHFDIGNI